MRTRRTLLTCLGLLFAGVAPAQVVGGGSGWAIHGFQQLDVDALSSHLQGMGIPAPGDRFFANGGGGHGFVGSVVVGGEGMSLFGETGRNDRHTASMSGGYGMAKIGFLAYQTRRLFLYPSLGIGGGQISLKVTDYDANPNAITELNAALFLMDISLGTEYLVELSGNEDGAGGIIVGLQAGYIMTPSKRLWDQDSDADGVDVGISTIPKAGVEGPYLRLIIGGGGFGYRDQ